MVPLLQFFVRAYVTFVLSFLFLIFPSFGASGRLCFVIVAFSGHLYLHFVALTYEHPLYVSRHAKPCLRASDQNHHSSLTEALDIKECTN